MKQESAKVLCMKWGDLYGPEYVNRLFSMVRRNLRGDLRFVCLTDNVDGIRPEVECHPCPEVPIPAPHNRRGWRKLCTYSHSENLFGLTGEWLYLDLDVVITGSLDEFFLYKPEKSFVVMQNWTQPGKGIGNTSVYRFRVGAESYLLEKLIREQDSILNTFNNSQTYISRNVRELTFWPDDWCALFKVQCVAPWPLRFWKEPKLPPRTRIVAFPGVPNPHQALKGEWPVNSPFKKIYKSIRPATWIANFWCI